MQRFFNIAANTFLESIRQPIYGVVLLATALLLVLNVSLAGFTLEDDDKLLLDLGLSTLLMGGLFLAIFSATGVLTREIENKTVLTVVSKPISRPVLILGKYAGLIASLVAAFYLCFLVFLLTMRHKVLQNSSDPWDGPALTFGIGAVALAFLIAAFCNFFYGSEFSMLAVALSVPLLTIGVVLTGFWNKTWEPQTFGKETFYPDLFVSAFLVFLSVMVLAAVALTVSTRFSQVMTLLICVLVTIAGLISDFLLGEAAQTSLTAGVAYRAVPNLGYYWVLDAVNSGLPVPGQYVGLVTAYTCCIVVGILSVGIALFQTREVG